MNIDIPSKEALCKMTPEELAELLIITMQALKQSTENMQALTGLLEAANTRINELADTNASQEAELIALRNRP